jgi:hypothetical protein
MRTLDGHGMKTHLVKTTQYRPSQCEAGWLLRHFPEWLVFVPQWPSRAVAVKPDRRNRS